MPANVLVVVIDGLRTSALGAYGNTTFLTPSLDQFAAESLLFDSCYGTSPELSEIYQALWYSSSPMLESAQDQHSLPRVFSERGYQTSVFTDEAQLISIVAAAGFQHIERLADESDSQSTPGKAADPFKTRLASLFNACSRLLRDRSVPNNLPQLVWLHAGGMYGIWDAPLNLQESLLDESDPLPLDVLNPSNLQIDASQDPDVAFRYACAYAAEIMAFDVCWEAFVSGLLESSDAEWLILLIGARGFPLGEHHRVGGVDSRLYAEQLNVPWLIRFPNGLGRLARADGLTTHSDVLPTLLEGLGLSAGPAANAFEGLSASDFASGHVASRRRAIMSKSATSRSIRTDSWCLREDFGVASGLPELYVRPDDRWEANDVAKLCPDTVEELRSMWPPE